MANEIANLLRKMNTANNTAEHLFYKRLHTVLVNAEAAKRTR